MVASNTASVCQLDHAFLLVTRMVPQSENTSPSNIPPSNYMEVSGFGHITKIVILQFYQLHVCSACLYIVVLNAFVPIT